MEHFKEDRLYYSYLTCGGMIGSIDTIAYDPSYEKEVKDFEEMYKGTIVYHAIECLTTYGRMLSMLFVGKDSEQWEYERECDGWIFSYTINMDMESGQSGEFGDIRVAGFENSGILIRIS